ncbi:di-N-acetylchitobiase-like [Branchiostoma floridae]|uniref:Di-N-acetylchitobiase n=1 Tax=Branchiostoma floridae TaxID=7739 RepID=A0A9J7N4V8_BRAFL|nr:di-N-acetylchitobiase-like [Branchiostoma floridae]
MRNIDSACFLASDAELVVHRGVGVCVGGGLLAWSAPPTPPCPCAQPELCQPVKTPPRKEIFVFAVKNDTWKHYDWDRVTTVVMFGFYSAELMCYAHSKGARVVLKGDIKAEDVPHLYEPRFRDDWVTNKVSLMIKQHMDGINIDIEQPIPATDPARDGLTKLVNETTWVFHAINKAAQVTFDVAWSPDCIDGRCYDIVNIAKSCDFLFVMSYDERSQITGPCVASANSALETTLGGYEEYLKMGIPPDQLVMGVPWYGYDYPCLDLSKDDVCSIKKVPFRGAPCSDAAGRQVDFKDIMRLMGNSSRKWSDIFKSPYFNFQEGGITHQMWFDDPVSLQYKYGWALKQGLRGVGMWHGDTLDYVTSDPEVKDQTQAMWDCLPQYHKTS